MSTTYKAFEHSTDPPKEGDLGALIRVPNSDHSSGNGSTATKPRDDQGRST